MKTYRDTMTDQDKADLADFLASYDAERNFLRENPYTPLFGQYAPSIGHYEPNLLYTDPEDNAGKPDDHYYQAQGQEPPTAIIKGDGNIFKGIGWLLLLYGFLILSVYLLVWGR